MDKKEKLAQIEILQKGIEKKFILLRRYQKKAKKYIVELKNEIAVMEKQLQDLMQEEKTQ